MKKTLAVLLSAMLAISCGVPVMAAPAVQQAEPAGADVILTADLSAQYNLTVLSDSEFLEQITGGEGTGTVDSINDDDNNDADVSSGASSDGPSDTIIEFPAVPNNAPVASSSTTEIPAGTTGAAGASAKVSSQAAPVQAPNAATAQTAQMDEPKTYTGVEGYVERLYDFVLGRGGSRSEIAEYSNALREGTSTAADVAYGFFNSSEFNNRNVSDSDYVVLLYRTILGRGASNSEINEYVSALKGSSRNSILAIFVSSNEFKNLCAGFGVTPGTISLDGYSEQYGGTTRFVQRLYNKALNRGASSSEIEERVREIMDGRSSAALMGYQFFNSPEFQNRNLSNSEFVLTLYQTILDRGASQSEINYYTEWLDNGTSRMYIYSNFIGSREFQDLCNTYGVPIGTLELDAYDSTLRPAWFARRQYILVLGRSGASKDEIRERTNQLVDGAGAAQMTSELFTSPEFKGRKLSDAEYIETLYRALLDRGASQKEIEYYQDMLDQGASRNYLLSNFLGSAEFKSLVDSYGINLGTVSLPDVVGPASTNNFDGYENGLDVSKYQGSINWSAVKSAGYDFVIVRATTYVGGQVQVDPYFYEYVRGAKNAGLKVGAYVYTYSYSTSGVNAELNALYTGLAQIESEGYRLEYPVFWDVEANNYTNQASKSDLTTLAKYALDSMRSKGYYSALYTYTNFANTRLEMSRLSGYDFWVAQYGPRVTYGGSYTMWQYTSSGSVPGVSGNVDLNYSYKDYESEIKNGGWNHW